ncbi:hypothetical protein DPEC_G00319030 [Dallia pectoralis]|uniref:Uncharacterized protein n=1 Tax=Dallia pectoralis TaxID=75939 RepID=A0ACC2F9N8_DALPE|nr:hypothetical protein DPEC_G00319030 [Dallia pectoralis]
MMMRYIYTVVNNPSRSFSRNNQHINTGSMATKMKSEPPEREKNKVSSENGHCHSFYWKFDGGEIIWKHLSLQRKQACYLKMKTQLCCNLRSALTQTTDKCLKYQMQESSLPKLRKNVNTNPCQTMLK